MKKHILVIGGGISGLTVLHELKKRYRDRDDVDIRVLEKNDIPGGTIQSRQTAISLFETGPSGFLTGYPQTVQLIDELGLRDEVVEAHPSARRRYVAVAGRLHALPLSPLELFSFEPLSLVDKLRLLMEIRRQPRLDHDETVREFGERRFGRRFTEVILDPVVSGIYAGDIDRLSVRSAFPRIYAHEQDAGSVIRGFIREKRRSKEKTQFLSFRHGMAEAVRAIARRYRDHVRTGEEAIHIGAQQGRYVVSTGRAEYPAHQLFVCAPAHVACGLLRGIAPGLADCLGQIPYAPVAVIGLVFDKKQVPDRPEGFGFLIPSGERREVLGVLFEDQIFPGRAAADQALFRVMIGGARHPESVLRPLDELTRLALDQLKMAMRIEGPARETHHAVWPKAIPQYEVRHPHLLRSIRTECERAPNLHLSGNYLEGVSFNDCIRHAARAVGTAAPVV